MTHTLPQIPPKPPGDGVRGFLPDHEGQQLYEWASQAAPVGPLLEIGSYCGRSTLWLGQAAKAHDTVVFALDHHRGSEEHQPGESHHDEALVDTKGQFDSFGEFRRNIMAAGLEDTIIPIVARSETVGPYWQGGLGMVFIDGGHSLDAALTDYRAWAPHVLPGGILAIHDNKIELILRPHNRHLAQHGIARGATDNISQKQQTHFLIPIKIMPF